VSSGVRNLSVNGRMRVVLKPTINFPPFFGGVQVCFLGDISINFDLDGMAKVGDWPLMRKNIRKAIIEDASKSLVYPNKFIVPMTSRVDPMLIKCMDPRSVLAVKVCSAKGLPKEGGLRKLVGQQNPDTYIETKFGGNKYKTPIIRNDDAPVWKDAQWYYFWIESHERQSVAFYAYDHDTFSSDDFLGKAVAHLDDVPKVTDEQEITLDLQDDALENSSSSKPTKVSGTLNVTMKWLPLEQQCDTPTIAVLTVFIYSCNNLTTEGNEQGVPGHVVVKVAPPAGLIDKNLIKVSEVQKNTQHPTFEEGFIFTLTKDDEWTDGKVSLEVLDERSKKVFGSLSFPINELKDAPANRKISGISAENPTMTITYSAKIVFAKND